jgi:vancomycin permeability regulator SanA
MRRQIASPRWKRYLLAFLLAVAALAAAAILAQWWLDLRAEDVIFHDLSDVPARPVGIIFGAGLRRDGSPSAVLQARVDAGVALYRAHRVRRLLVTGDNSTTSHDEVSAMKRCAIAQGVPPSDIVRDFAGFRTFDSCYRARHIFDVHSAVLITQAYHLPRALFLARGVGIDAVGFAAAPGASRPEIIRFRIREAAASANAVLHSFISPERPHFLGKPEPIFGSSSPAR